MPNSDTSKQNKPDAFARNLYKSKEWIRVNASWLWPLAVAVPVEDLIASPFASSCATACVTMIGGYPRMYMNYKWMRTLSTKTFRFVYVHELMHIASKHMTRMVGPEWDAVVFGASKDATVQGRLANIAQDYVINNYLLGLLNNNSEQVMTAPDTDVNGNKMSVLVNDKYIGMSAEKVYRELEASISKWKIEMEDISYTTDDSDYGSGYRDGYDDGQMDKKDQGNRKGKADLSNKPEEYQNGYLQGYDDSLSSNLPSPSQAIRSSGSQSTTVFAKIPVLVSPDGKRYPIAPELTDDYAASDPLVKKAQDIVDKALKQGSILSSMNKSAGFDPNASPWKEEIKWLFKPRRNIVEKLHDIIEKSYVGREREWTGNIDFRWNLSTLQAAKSAFPHSPAIGAIKPPLVFPKKMICDLCVVIDSSGSIDSEQLTEFISIVFDMTRNYNLRNVAILVHSDTVTQKIDIDSPEDMESALKSLRVVSGRGGTSYKAPYELIKKEYDQCKTIIHLTDLYPWVWPSPEELPDSRIIYLVNKQERADITPPYGEVIEYEPSDFEKQLSV